MEARCGAGQQRPRRCTVPSERRELVGASGLPLWLFSGLLAVVYGLTVPLAAIAMALLYGDAAAAQETGEPAEPEPVPAG